MCFMRQVYRPAPSPLFCQRKQRNNPPIKAFFSPILLLLVVSCFSQIDLFHLKLQNLKDVIFPSLNEILLLQQFIFSLIDSFDPQQIEKVYRKMANALPRMSYCLHFNVTLGQTEILEIMHLSLRCHFITGFIPPLFLAPAA